MGKNINLIVGGGLGNQLFQYATYLYLKATYPKACVNLDFFMYYFDAFHNGIEIQKIFDIDQKKEIEQIEHRRKSNKKNRKIAFPLHTLKYKILGYKTLYEIDVCTPDKLDGAINEYNKLMISGFFQSPLFIEKIKDELLKRRINYGSLGAQNDRLLSKIKQYVSVSLHVRRGDYIGLSQYDVIKGTNYYKNAMNYFKSKYSNILFVVFSNDIPWVKENIKIDGEVEYVDWNDSENSFKDMLLMSACNHNIIVNSTFSWWGAWLNRNPNKDVIAPKDWFVDKLSTEVVPADWQLINNK